MWILSHHYSVLSHHLHLPRLHCHYLYPLDHLHLVAWLVSIVYTASHYQTATTVALLLLLSPAKSFSWQLLGDVIIIIITVARISYLSSIYVGGSHGGYCSDKYRYCHKHQDRFCLHQQLRHSRLIKECDTSA